MQREVNLLNTADNWTHFWAGSLDTHNLTNPDYIKRHPSIIKREMNDMDQASYDAMILRVKRKCFKDPSHPTYKEQQAYYDALDDAKLNQTIALLQDRIIFTKEQVNVIFNTVMTLATDLSNEWECKFRGFRFAVNGGRSVNPESLSICTYDFLQMKKGETLQDVIVKCTEQFAFYLWCYSDKLKAWRKENNLYYGKSWKTFKPWWESASKKIAAKIDLAAEVFGFAE